MKYVVIISIILSIFLCFLSFSKNPKTRTIGRFTLIFGILFSSFLVCYCFYMAFFVPNSNASGLGNGIFSFIAIIPLGFACFLGGVLYESYKSEKNYWIKSQAERDSMDNVYRAQAKAELVNLFKNKK